jgi:predicted lipoprotein with Yx(FWY)xxD motif
MTIHQPPTDGEHIVGVEPGARPDPRKEQSMSPGDPRRTARDWKRLILRIVGAGLLIATAAIHLDLYVTGYRTIPTIGWLFLLQVIVAFLLGFVVLGTGSRLVAAAGAGFAVATLGGYLLTLWIGLFGFREVRTSVGIEAAIVEIVGFAVLAALALDPAVQRRPAVATTQANGLLDQLQAGLPVARWGILALSVIAAALLGSALGTAAGPAATGPGPSTALVKVADVNGVKVLTNAKGFTLYVFAPDPPGKSTCYSTCAVYWPPVTGKPVAGAGVTGKLGTIKRTNGQIQVTYNHHPLYTYIGDTGPGKASGNDIDLNGGFWYDVKAAG